MIRFSLICDHDHEFEAWFRSNDDFDTQKKRGFVECPSCGSHKVDKALMAPAVSTGRKQEKIALAMGEAAAARPWPQLKEMSEKMRENADYVGDKFAEEARKIHFGETEARGIYGEATLDEAKSLAEDGVELHADPGVSGRPELGHRTGVCFRRQPSPPAPCSSRPYPWTADQRSASGL